MFTHFATTARKATKVVRIVTLANHMQNGDQQPRTSNQSRRFCFTLNNPIDEELASIRAQETGDLLTYLIAGLEVGELGTPHVQGYLETARRSRFGTLRVGMPWLSRAALLVARGSFDDNHRYCSKEGNVLREIGDPIVPGKRRDLEEIRTSIDQGVPLLEIARRNFSKWCIYRRSFEAYKEMQRETKELRLLLEVIVYWGPPGTGKTRKVYEVERDDLFFVPHGGQWFDGYAGQECVLFDDFDGSIDYRLLLRLCDIYPLTVPIKGGFVHWTPKRIYFTSNKEPQLWYPAENYGPLGRRIHRVEEFTN